MKHSASPCWGCPPNPRHGLFFRPCRSRRWGRLRPRPQTPAGPIFSYGRKDRKRPFKGAPAPLKIPRWGALWPCPQTPRPGSSVIGVNVLGANKRALRYLNSLYLVGLFQNPATAQQADSPVPGARCPGISQCNLSLFYSDWAERSSRVGLRPNALAFRKTVRQNVSSETLATTDP